MPRIKQLALLALRDHNPFKFINDMARVHGVRIEMRVELCYTIWKVELDCESEHDPAQFYELWKPLERRGYVRGCGTSTYPPVPIRLGLDEPQWWQPRTTCRKHHLSLVFPSSIPPRQRMENLMRYEIMVENPV